MGIKIRRHINCPSSLTILIAKRQHRKEQVVAGYVSWIRRAWLAFLFAYKTIGVNLSEFPTGWGS